MYVTISPALNCFLYDHMYCTNFSNTGHAMKINMYWHEIELHSFIAILASNVYIA